MNVKELIAELEKVDDKAVNVIVEGYDNRCGVVAEVIEDEYEVFLQLEGM